MTELVSSTGFILVAYAWYLAARRFDRIPFGPRWLRGFLGTGLVGYACFAVTRYLSETVCTDWTTACTAITIVVLHLVIAILMAFMLWTIKETYWIRLSFRKNSKH